MKDINVIMPEEVRDAKKAMNLCFENENILDAEKYVNILEKNYADSYVSMILDRELSQTFAYSMSARDRFYVTQAMLDSGDIFEDFLIGRKFCYSIKRELAARVSHSKLRYVDSVYLSHSLELPHFDFRHLQNIPLDLSARKLLHIASYFYRTMKLSWPYRDDCVDYDAMFGIPDRLVAIGQCYNAIRARTDRKLSQCFYVTRNDEIHLNETLSMDDCDITDDVCDKHYAKLDCDQTIHFTTIKWSDYDTATPQTPFFAIQSVPSPDPSFVIESKPRIDNIEFVTYVFGALGTWFGFSFLMLNPVPFVLSVRSSNQVAPHSRGVSDESEGASVKREAVVRLRDRILMLEREKVVLKSNDTKLRLDLDQVIGRLCAIETIVTDTN